MTVVNYWSHIPHIRLEDEHAQLGPGRLWRVPFEVWNHLMVGAFEDHRDAYDATAPVCFFLEAEVDWEFLVEAHVGHTANIEAKQPSFADDDLFARAGLGFMTHFNSAVAPAAQAALTLVDPTVAPGSPRMSVTMFKADDAVIQFGDRQATGARLQGDADHEWMMMPESAGVPLRTATVANASAVFDFAWTIRDHPDLGPALDALLRAAQPTLDARQRLVVCTIALEALLMPEARSDLAATFRSRIAALLPHLPNAESAARVLYQGRSAALHGDDPRSPDEVADHADRCVAQTTLAAAVLALGPSLLAGADLDEVRRRLDDGEAPENPIEVPTHDLAAAPHSTSWRRLEHSSPSSVVAVGRATMASAEGGHIAWCPLIGLHCDELLASPVGAFTVDRLEGFELMELEERDIRRDFMAGVANSPSGMPTQAVLGLVGDGAVDLDDLRRRRRDAVLALRLAGYSHFVDPSLLGWYVFEGIRRTRFPAVFRQSVIQQAAHPAPETIGRDDEIRIAELAGLIDTYRHERADSEVDALLDEFLVAHPNDFVPGETSAALLLAAIEGTLGRFRPRSADVQLEDLVAIVADDEPAAWFRAEGRSFRNAVAHGRWSASYEPRTSDVELIRLTEIVRSVTLDFLDVLTAGTDPDGDPGDGRIDDPIERYRRHLERRAA